MGNPGVICCYRQDDVIIDPGPASSVPNLLEALDGFVPRAILLTHVHLDHASGSGLLMEQWPDAELWVHELGAPHMIDPERLVASATRLYGDRMEELWGEIVPADPGRVRALGGGEVIGDWEVAYTPGHARHHVSYLHRPSMTAFTGDVAGMRIGEGPVLPPTPPPDIDLAAWRESLGAIEAWQPEALALTHFGEFADVEVHLNSLRRNLDMVEQWAGELTLEEFAAELDDWLRSETSHHAAEAYAQVMPADACYAGLERARTRGRAG
ncbi:MAG: MBL fold metallo-hydrolase [Solirubrobacterales bacterium]